MLAPGCIVSEIHLRFNSFITRSGIALLNLESINTPGEIVTFLKLETFQINKTRGLSRLVNVIVVQSRNY